MDPVLIPIIAIVSIFSIPLCAIWTGHKRQMMEMTLRRGSADGGVQQSIDALR